MTADWYVIQTNPQCEHKAAAELRRAGLRVYLPKRSIEVKDRKAHGIAKLRFRPLLIGYLFVRFPDAMHDRHGNPQFGAVRMCQGVKGYVRSTNSLGEWEPFSVPERHVADFMRRQRRREFGRPQIISRAERMAALRKTLKPGSRVRITDGPFVSFLATLQRLNSNMTVAVEASIFGRPTSVTLEVGQFDVVGLAPRRKAA